MDEPITIICPTRARPNNVRRLIKSILDTSSDKSSIHFRFYVDNDDTLTIQSIKDISNEFSGNIGWNLGNRILMSEMSNILARGVLDDSILFLCGDDIVFETKDWDIEVRKAFEQFGNSKIGMVYGDDGLMHETLATHFFLHTNWVEALGYVVPPIFTGDWADNWVTSMANGIGRKIYLPNVKTTHMHPTAGKAAMDQIYYDKYMRDIKSNPQAIFNNGKDLRDKDIKKLRNFINDD